jgi:hypothetical protein
MAILKALEDNGQGTHHVMDPFQARYNNGGLANVRAAGLQHRIVFHEKFAEEVVPQLPALQFGFIDASHLFDLTLVEYVLIDKKLDVGGLIGMHDMWMASLQKLYRYVSANRAYRRRQDLEPLYAPRLTFRSRVKQSIAEALRMVPKSRKIFRPEILHPWSEFNSSNLLLLEKTGVDQREWTFHAPF